jgi:cobyrinic acid a,c-diamide synthase
VIVLDITKTTRTAAAFVAGCRTLDPDVVIAGVVLNRVGGPRHVGEARTAIEEQCGVPVVGAIPKLKQDAKLLPDRHLGLVPPEEHDRMGEVVDRLADVLKEHVDTEGLLETAERTTGKKARAAPAPAAPPPPAAGRAIRVGVFRDSAFTFYYPENLEALEAAGADLVAISPVADEALPDVDLLYVGGGFPETHAPVLSGNRSMLRRVREAALAGLPVYAECGGLIYLSRSVRYAGRTYPLAGVLDADVEVMKRPQGHGYAEAVVDRANPFFAEGTVLRGHEFHYSRIVPGDDALDLALQVRRGAGSVSGRDGLVKGNVFASWIHLHALGTPGWADALVARARDRASTRTAYGSRTA